MQEDTLGLRLGMRDLGRILNRRIQEANGNVDKMQRIADEIYEEKKAVEKLLREARLALAVEKAHSAGLKAKVRAYAAVIGTLSPNEPLLQKTGRTYEDGSAEKRSDLVYDEAFDKVLSEKGVQGAFRAYAR